MAITNRTFVAGIYGDIIQVDKVVDSLQTAGFQDSQIAIDSREKGTQHIQDTLVDIGMPEPIAQAYEEALGAGKLTLLVRTDERQDEAINILRAKGGASLWHSGQDALEQAIPLREERLQPVRQQVVSGEVRIRRRIILEEKTITVQVAREEITVENLTFSRDEEASELPSDSSSKIIHLNPGDTIRIPVREEQVFVEKRPIIKEEVIVTKQ
ncbi:MAG: YsnF/AvaK domain-containing protein, partial [Ktedonobacteraceae bacterium]|nr:YsnF/AvaK domain-containing protein [Ktedonobacteraceae bacterium]